MTQIEAAMDMVVTRRWKDKVALYEEYFADFASFRNEFLEEFARMELADPIDV